jgi:hypothetical protein
MFPAVLGAAALLSAVTLSAIDNSFVVLESDVQAVEVGDIFSVQVFSSAHVPVNAVDITVSFPSDKVEVFGVDRGESVLTIWTEDPIVTNKTVTLRGGTFRKGFLGEHQIATINFRAKGTGQYTIKAPDATFIAGDGAGTEVLVSEHSADKLSIFNFDDNTTEEEIKIAVGSQLKTDLNEDGKVTLQDISAFMGVWSNKTQLFDFNGDGRMSFKDFSIILADFFLQ